MRGRQAKTGLPDSVTINSVQVREALAKPIEQIVASVKSTLELTEPELAADLVERGINLCGGGALLRGIDKRIHQAIDIPVTIAEDPLTAVARGTGFMLDNLELMKQILETAEDL